jgi:hypothetical protein
MSGRCIIQRLGVGQGDVLCVEPSHIAELCQGLMRIETQAFSSIREVGRVSKSRVRRLESELCDDISSKKRGWADGSRDGIGRQ